MQRAASWTAVLVFTLAAGAAADEHLVPNQNAPLSGKTVVFSPGHGFQTSTGRWQRGVTHDVREDIHTNEIFVEYIQRYLANAGARVESVRERSFQTREAIVDAGGAGYAESGTWTASTSAPAYYGGSGYRWASCDPNGGAAATFTPNLPEAGRYPVYAWWTKGGNRATDARFTVHHTGGQTTVVVDQQTVGDHWMFLGEFHFAAGGAGRVVLSNQGADATKVVIADAVRWGGGVGPSGFPRWQESAGDFLRHKGYASSRGDVTIRPGYATWLAGGDTSRWRRDFVYVALHSNAGGGEGLSTFSYSNGRTPSWGSAGPRHYPTAPSPLEGISDALAAKLHAEVLSAIRAHFDPAWPDRRTHRMNFGELREARNMPSALLELGFHDHVEDAALLRDAAFRRVAARAIYKGILRHFDPNAPVLPLAPEGLVLENLGGGQLRVSWTPVNDPLEPSAAPASFKVYVSPDGRGFDDGRVVSQTSVVLSGLTPGQPVFVRVAALNAGGESLTTRTGGALVGEPGVGALLVDGFDRAYRHTYANIGGRYTYDYAIEHLAALAATVPPGVPVDYAENEAVAAGAVNLDVYGLVDWLLGREGSVTRTFDPAEQQAVQAYLQAGGTLLASGTEIGWDLEARGGGVSFFHDVLGARYAADDGGSATVRPSPGGPLAALGTLRFDTGRYVAASPDALGAARPDAEALLAYEAAGAPTAGVGVRMRSVVLGFPLESVGDPTAREGLTREALAFLAPSLRAGTPSGGGASGGGSAGGGGSTAPVGSTAAPATQQQVASGGGGGGGCSLASDAEPGDAPWAWLALALALLGLRRRAARDA